jgi:hypothetical protein
VNGALVFTKALLGNAGHTDGDINIAIFGFNPDDLGFVGGFKVFDEHKTTQTNGRLRGFTAKTGGLTEHHVGGAFGQFLAKAALIELGDQRALQLVALV